MRDVVQNYSGITEFQRKVYLELLNVPAGETVSYKELGLRIGCRSAQAIGQALKRNPFAVGCSIDGLTFTHDFCVPCHRVLASDGSLCGFSGHRTGPELDRKRRLLAEEGVI